MGNVFFGGGKVDMVAPSVSRLPSGYTELAYIEGDGASYINTGVCPTNNTKLEVYAEPNDVGNFYAATTAAATRVGLYVIDGGRIDMAFGTTGYKGSVLTGVSYPAVMTLENGTLTASGVSATFTTQSAFTMSYTLNLFAHGTSAVAGRLYYCKIYESGVLVRDFVPCISDTDGVGLFDLVESKFYGNAGTGSFIGSEVA